MVVSFDIDPVPASRPRVVYIGRKCRSCHRGMVPIAYYDKPYKTFKAAAVKAIKAALPKGYEPMDGKLIVRIIVTVQKPKTSKLEMPKPDWDNYAKGVCDAANKLVWTDDSRIKRGVLEKQWGGKGSVVMEVVPYARKARA